MVGCVFLLTRHGFDDILFITGVDRWIYGCCYMILEIHMEGKGMSVIIL